MTTAKREKLDWKEQLAQKTGAKIPKKEDKNHKTVVLVSLSKIFFEETFFKGKKRKEKRYILESMDLPNQEFYLDDKFYQNKKLSWVSKFLEGYSFLYVSYRENGGKNVINFVDRNMPFRVPQDARKIIESNSNYRFTENYNLQLNYFAHYEQDKFQLLKDKKLIANPNFSKIPFANICTNQTEKASQLCHKIESKNLSIDWRLIVGLGNESVYETSITLHHIYGIPYIPASAVKGVIHHWAIDQLKEQTENKENPVNPEILSEKQIEDILGTEDKQGKIIFFDAFPCSKPTIEPDIMNPHYPDYYGGEEAPTDYQNPRPIFFLTVENTSFQFIIGVRKAEDSGLLNTAKEWLKKALSEKGIGAKTAVGYGYMS